jgi:hypothetical protein
VTATAHLDDDVLSALLDGELSEAEWRSAADHQSACAACQARAAALGDVGRVLRVAFPRSMPDAWPAWPGWPDARLDAVVSEALGGSRAAGSIDDAGRRRFRRYRRSRVRAVAAAAAVFVGVGLALSALEHAPPPSAAARTGAAPGVRGLSSSFGSFAGPASLGPALLVEIESLAAGHSGAGLPCRAEAALLAGRSAALAATFSAPLTYRGVASEVFAYEAPSAGGGGANGLGGLAVVVADGNCDLVARVAW